MDAHLTPLSIAVLILYGLTAAVNVWANAVRNSRMKSLTKPFLLPLLMLAYVIAAAQTGGEMNRVLLLALLLGWIGDITLRRIAVGAFFFLLGHLAYIAAIIIQYDGRMPPVSFIILLGLVFLGLAAFLLWRAWPEAKQIFFVPILYSTVSIVLGVLSALLLVVRTDLNAFATGLGGQLFLLSDSVLSLQIFKRLQPDQPPDDREHRGTDYAGAFVMAAYTAAQLLLTLGTGQLLRMG